MPGSLLSVLARLDGGDSFVARFLFLPTLIQRDFRRMGGVRQSKGSTDSPRATNHRDQTDRCFALLLDAFNRAQELLTDPRHLDETPLTPLRW